MPHSKSEAILRSQFISTQSSTAERCEQNGCQEPGRGVYAHYYALPVQFRNHGCPEISWAEESNRYAHNPLSNTLPETINNPMFLNVALLPSDLSVQHHLVPVLCVCAIQLYYKHKVFSTVTHNACNTWLRFYSTYVLCLYQLCH